MQRRKFLKSSAAGVSIFLTPPSLEPLKADPTESPKVVNLAGAPVAKFVEIASTTYEAKDSLTAVPVDVTLGKFLMAATEVTQRDFEAVMGYNPSFHQGAELPVESVSWWEAIQYCNLRSIRENIDPCYSLETGSCDLQKNGYRLPTEAEWTHACGGETGYTLASGQANVGSSDMTSVALLMQELETSGTKPVGSYAPNPFGLYDMIGNVWEWCNDYFSAVPTPRSSYNPAGPARGLARVVRGGSFVSTTAQSPAWARDYRLGMEPGYKSRFTGFRVCRTSERRAAVFAAQVDAKWFEPYDQPPPGYEKTIGNLSPLVSSTSTVSEWEAHRPAIRAKWLTLLGGMEIQPTTPEARFVETVMDQYFSGKLMYLQVESDRWEKILVMMPSEALTHPRPVVIVPFYDVDDPFGHDVAGRQVLGGLTTAFARLAVQRGYIAVAIRWFGDSYGEAYTEAVANLKLRHPHCTGLGKWVWDAQRLLDYLYTLPEVDRQHIGIIGHSLGGKMALYAGAFDERITVVVTSEPGIGLNLGPTKHNNYDAYWYFGDFIFQRREKETDHHELLGLIAPRPYLLIGGDEYDTAESWYYINAARQVCDLYGKRHNVGYFNHHHGHRPTPEADQRAMDWLERFLGPAA